MSEHDHQAHHARVRAIRLGWRVSIAVFSAIALVFFQRTLSQWVDRTAVFISALGLLVAFVLLFDWVLDLVGPPIWRFVKSASMTAARALATDPEVLRLARRHPRLWAWIRNRMTLASPRGFYLTVTVLAASYFFGGFVAIARGVATAGAITTYDPQIMALLRAFRGPGLTRFLWVFTVLGDVRVAYPLAIVAIILLELWAHRRDALFVGVSVAGGSALGTVVKLLFQRERPGEIFALITTPGSYSFPSGHALYSMLIAFSLAFVIARRARTLRARLTAIGVATFFALLTAISRIYLGVHWMSDTVASWLLGFSWLTICIGVLVTYERYSGAGRERATTDRPRIRRRITVIVSLVAALAVIYGAQQDPLLADATKPSAVREWRVTRAVDGTPKPTQAEASVLPRWSENIDGSNMNPIGLIFVGTERQLLTAFERARWQVAEKPSVTNVMRIVVAAIADHPYPTAPVSPSFVNGHVHQIAFQKPVGGDSARRRHHTRFWKTDFTVKGVPVWVATASLDAGVQIGSAIPVPTHRIAPEIDAEQRYIVRSVIWGGAAHLAGKVRVTTPTTGRNAAGDQWFTQGIATVLVPFP